MSHYSQFSKSGFQALLRLPHPSNGMDAVAFGSRRHLVVAVTAVVGDRREVVGVEVQPLPKGLVLSEWPGGTYAPGRLMLRLERVLETYAEFEGDELQPVSAALLRGIPLTTLLAFRAEEVRLGLQRSGVAEAGGFRRLGSIGTPMSDEQLQNALRSKDLPSADEVRLAYLDDALLYVQALHERAKPAEVIADARGVSKRTAEGRIAKARSLGLLTKASGRTASGDLTTDGQRLKEWRDQITSAGEGTDV